MRSRTLAACIVCSLALAVINVGAQDAAAVAKRRAELEKVLDDYAAGNRGAASRAIRGHLDSVTTKALTQFAGDLKVSWTLARAAFILEAAVSLDRTSGGSARGLVSGLVRSGYRFVIARPAAIGANGVEDRFEILWHQIGLALLQGNSDWGVHSAYVTDILPRMEKMSQLNPPLPSRFALARGVNAMAPAIVMNMLARSSNPPVRTRPDEASALFEAAAEIPALRVEALVRSAYLDWVRGRWAAAIATLDRVGPITDDVLAYGAAIVRAGSLDALERPADAAEAYAVAKRLAPATQVPVIGRAAALHRAGLVEEAVAEANLARHMRAGSDDLWPTFQRVDARFIWQWLLELRTLLP